MSPSKPTPRDLYEGVCIRVLGWMIDARPPLQEVGQLFEDFENFMAELSRERKTLKEKDVVDRAAYAGTVRNGGGPFAV